MAWVLDLIALAAVIAALAFLLRPRRQSGCGDCAPAARGGETRIALTALRASARRAGLRD